MKTRKLLIHVLLLSFVLSTLAFAQGKPKLELKVLDQKVNMTAAEKAGSAKIAYRPGDVIHYTVVAHNAGNGEMTNPVITDPIPQGVAYIPGSAKGEHAEITYSINKGKSFEAWPPTYKAKDSRGKTVKQVATPEMITHIRWELKKSLAPNESKNLEFEVKVK